MVLSHGDMLKCLSEKVYDLSSEIDEYAHACERQFSEPTVGNIVRIFATDENIIDKCKELVSTINIIVNLKDSEDNDEMQKEFCSHITQLQHSGITMLRYSHIKLNDFVNIHNNAVETISRMINVKCKQNIQEDGHYQDVVALIDDVEYIYKKRTMNR